MEKKSEEKKPAEVVEEAGEAIAEIIKMPFKIVANLFEWGTDWM